MKHVPNGLRDVVKIDAGGKLVRWRQDFVTNQPVPKNGPYTDVKATGYAFFLRKTDGKWELFANGAPEFSRLLEQMDGIQDIATSHANRAKGFFIGLKHRQ